MRTIFTLLVGVVAMVCTGCEVDDTELNNSKTYTLYEDISALVISNGVDVIVDDALPHDQVYALTNANNFNKLSVKVNDGTLHIGVSTFTAIFGYTRCLVYVPSVAYERVEMGGGGDFSWDSCNSDVLSVAVSGGSDCQIKGVTQKLSIDSSGGADVKCGELEAEDVTIDASGGSDVDAVANSTLSLTASGGADIHIKGNPQIVHWDISGGADVDFN
ncbi:MAG: DUF2807 domain-containing protein [Alistipes sp.]|nr:DUF2807 domain-containing protein [Alistipes sp.]